MTLLLQSKRDATKFQILVEIASHQPNVRQSEIAHTLGITPQAVSEYLKELANQGFVYSDGRVRYKTTAKGVEWITENAFALRRYARFILDEVVSQVAVWTAIADEPLQADTHVFLYMRDGLLYASMEHETNATGETISDVQKGKDVGVTNLKGIIDLPDVKIVIGKMPRVHRGGSAAVDYQMLKKLVKEKHFVVAIGVEALIALKNIGIDANVMFGAREAVVEAAWHGVPSFVLSVDDELHLLLKRLEAEGLEYELHDLKV
ncbi:MAG: winged helix-turn-helix transcriptional regulator [Euryarchaeota archaeon]|nr:winged helix-turn-helix transcriptional regulator [Euryarchaeota archaeon]